MIESIGPYRIEKEIGRDGIGVVFLARDAQLDRDVAIRSLSAEEMKRQQVKPPPPRPA